MYASLVAVYCNYIVVTVPRQDSMSPARAILLSWLGTITYLLEQQTCMNLESEIKKQCIYKYQETKDTFEIK